MSIKEDIIKDNFIAECHSKVNTYIMWRRNFTFTHKQYIAQ